MASSRATSDCCWHWSWPGRSPASSSAGPGPPMVSSPRDPPSPDRHGPGRIRDRLHSCSRRHEPWTSRPPCERSPVLGAAARGRVGRCRPIRRADDHRRRRLLRLLVHLVAALPALALGPRPRHLRDPGPVVGRRHPALPRYPRLQLPRCDLPVLGAGEALRLGPDLDVLCVRRPGAPPARGRPRRVEPPLPRPNPARRRGLSHLPDFLPQPRLRDGRPARLARRVSASSWRC